MAIGIEPVNKAFAALKSVFSRVRSNTELCSLVDRSTHLSLAVFT